MSGSHPQLSGRSIPHSGRGGGGWGGRRVTPVEGDMKTGLLLPKTHQASALMMALSNSSMRVLMLRMMMMMKRRRMVACSSSATLNSEQFGWRLGARGQGGVWLHLPRLALSSRQHPDRAGGSDVPPSPALRVAGPLLAQPGPVLGTTPVRLRSPFRARLPSAPVTRG